MLVKVLSKTIHDRRECRENRPSRIPSRSPIFATPFAEINNDRFYTNIINRVRGSSARYGEVNFCPVNRARAEFNLWRAT